LLASNLERLPNSYFFGGVPGLVGLGFGGTPGLHGPQPGLPDCFGCFTMRHSSPFY